MSLDFVIKMVDELSEPARKGTGSLLDLDKQAKVLQSTLMGLDKQLVKAQALGDTSKATEIIGKQTQIKDSLHGIGYEAEASSSKWENAILGMVDPVQLALVAVEALVAGVAALGIGLIAGAIKAESASEELAKMRTQLGALGDSAGETGDDLISMLEEMSDKLPQTKDQLAEWAKPLLAAGLHGQALQETLEATSASAALMGDRGVQAFDALQKKIQAAADSGQALKIPVKGLGSLAETGVNVADVAAKMGISADELGARLKAGTVDATAFGDALNAALIDKGKPAMDQASNSLESIGAKAKANLTDLFENTDTTAFNAGLKDLAGLLDRNSASGKFLREAVKAIFDKVFELAAKALPYVKHGFQEMEIAALKIYIAAKPLIKQLGELSDKLFDNVDGGDLASGALDILTTTLSGMATDVGIVVGEVNDLIDVMIEVSDWFDKGTKAANDFATSLDIKGPDVASILPGAGGTVGGVGKALGLPGFAEGGTVPGPEGAPTLAVVHGGEQVIPVGGGGGGGGVNVTFQPGAIVIQGVGSNGEAIELTTEALAIALERIALARGLGRAA